MSGGIQRRVAAFHLNQLCREGAWVIALFSDRPQLIVYSYGRVLGRLGCNCLFICLSLQSALQPPEGKGQALFLPLPGTRHNLCTEKCLGKLLKPARQQAMQSCFGKGSNLVSLQKTEQKGSEILVCCLCHLSCAVSSFRTSMPSCFCALLRAHQHGTLSC